MRKPIVLLFLFVFLFSCSPQKRLNKLILKHPELVQTDTIQVKETIIIPGLQIDTQFVTKPTDTVVIEKEKLHTVIYRKYDTLIVHQVLQPDTIFVEKKIPVDKVVYRTQEKMTPLTVVYIIIIVSLLLLLFVLLANMASK